MAIEKIKNQTKSTIKTAKELNNDIQLYENYKKMYETEDEELLEHLIDLHNERDELLKETNKINWEIVIIMIIFMTLTYTIGYTIGSA